MNKFTIRESPYTYIKVEAFSKKGVEYKYTFKVKNIDSVFIGHAGLFGLSKRLYMILKFNSSATNRSNIQIKSFELY